MKDPPLLAVCKGIISTERCRRILVRIPIETGHLFRFNPDTHSDVAGHRFR